MNESFVKIIIIMLGFEVSMAFGMNKPCKLLEIPHDIKRKIIAILLPVEKNILRQTCWEFKKSATIRAPEVFKIAQDHLLCAAEQDKIRIVLSAAAEGYYEVMENILRNQNNTHLFYSFHTNCFNQFCSFDLYSINEYKKDPQLSNVLKKYHIPRVSDIIEFNMPIYYITLNELIMACYSGNSERVKSVIQSDRIMVNDTQSLLNSFIVSIGHDDADCIQLLCEKIVTNEQFKKMHGKLLLEKALFGKNENASKALISGGCSDANEISNFYTVLDESTDISYIDQSISSFIKTIKKSCGMPIKKTTPDKKNNCVIQ